MKSLLRRKRRGIRPEEIKNTAKAETTETENFNGASGISGALTWNITTEGHLTIEGNGDYREDVSWENLPEWLEYKQYIKTATVNVQNITSTIFMFLDCSNLTDINLTNLDTSNITDMSYMFQGCSSLVTLDLSNFNTSNVTSMCAMFCECKSLTNLEQVKNLLL